MTGTYHSVPRFDPGELGTKAPVLNPAFVGRVSIPAASAATPGLGPIDDPDTGMFSPVANSLAFAVGGTERLRMATNGTVSLAGPPGAEGLRVLAVAGADTCFTASGSAGGRPILSVVGAAANIALAFAAKGAAPLVFNTTTGADAVIQAWRADAANQTIEICALNGQGRVRTNQGDLYLAPGTGGRVGFGTYVGQSGLGIDGYIEIKDAAGTIRRLATVA